MIPGACAVKLPWPPLGEVKVASGSALPPDRHPRQTVVTLRKIEVMRSKCCGSVGVGHVARVGRCRHCARLYRAPVPGGELWRPHAGDRAGHLVAASDLATV